MTNTSNLLKVKRLVDGDDEFGWRVEAACWAAGIEYTPQVLRAVAADQVVLTDAILEGDFIDSSNVSDDDIVYAVATIKNGEVTE